MMSWDDPRRLQYIGNTPSSDVPILSLILSSTLFNLLFYQILPSSKTPLIKTYIISTFHAFISVISVTNYFLKYEINFKQMNRLVGGGMLGTGDEMMVYSVCYSTGYFLYDLILMFVYKSVRSSSAIIHHLLIVLSFLIGLFTQVCHPCHFYFLAEELSTIPLNFKTIYRDHRHLHHLFSFLFVICFFLSRLVYGSIISIYAFRTAPQFVRLTWNFNDISTLIIGLIQALLCILTRLLNFYWAILILRKVLGWKSEDKQYKNL